MRIVYSTVLLLVLAVILVGTNAVAQGNPNPDITRPELQNFDRFLDGHPAVEQDLRKDPRLIENRAYVDSHPELKEFLGSHPGVREEIKETPRYFMEREERYDRNHQDITHGQVSPFDEFLDRHPNVDREISKNPSLIRNREYLAKHPELREYLDAHPAMRKEAQENPKAFMKRERKFDKREDKLEDKREEKLERKGKR